MIQYNPGGEGAQVGFALVKSALAKNGRWASVTAAVGGFVSDVLQPIAPFAAYVFLIGAVASAVLAVALVARLVFAERAAPALVFALLVTIVAGGIWQLQQAQAAEDGVVAGLLPAVAEMQKRLGIVAADVAEVKSKVTAISEKVSRVEEGQRAVGEAVRANSASVEGLRSTSEKTGQGMARVEDRVATLAEGQKRIEDATRQGAESASRAAESAGRVAAAADRLTGSIEDMARSFRSLAGSGGLVPDPRTAVEFYHNARLSEARGDALAARRSYLQLAALDIDAVDPWTRLATVVRVQDGRAGAREVFASLAARAQSPAYELVYATLWDDAERRRRIEAFAATHPDYGPAWFLLADEVSEARLGSQTLSEKRRERDALKRFLDAEDQGTLTRRFLDQSVLGEWLDGARRRKAVLDALLQTVQTEPRAIFTRSNADWSVYVQLPEPATGFAYRLSDAGPFQQAGAGFGTDTRTGRPIPNTTISVVPGTEPKAIDVTYLDLRGQEVGPFRIPFDPMAALVGQQKQTLEMTKGSWIAFRDYNGLIVYTTHLVTYRCTIQKATYGLDSQPVDQALPLPPCDSKDPFAIPASESTSFKVPATTKSMTVRLQFRDGTTAETTVPRR